MPQPTPIRSLSPFEQKIRRYAQLEAIARQYPPGEVPANIQDALVSMQAEYANLPPHQQAFATRQLNEARIVHSEANAAQSKMELQARRLRAGNRQLEMHKSLEGVVDPGKPLKMEHYAAIRNGAKKLTVRTGKAYLDKQAIAKTFEPHLPKLGLPKGATYEQISERMDDLLSARQRDNAGEHGAFSTRLENQKVTLDTKDLNEALDWWGEHGLKFAWAERMAERDKDMPVTEDIPVTEDLRSRVNSVSSMVESAMDNANDQDAFDEAASEFRQDTLEDDGMRGDIARAWLKTEAGEGVAARDERGEFHNPLAEV